MFNNLPLQIQTIEGALNYKIAPLAPPKLLISIPKIFKSGKASRYMLKDLI